MSVTLRPPVGQCETAAAYGTVWNCGRLDSRRQTQTPSGFTANNESNGAEICVLVDRRWQPQALSTFTANVDTKWHRFLSFIWKQMATAASVGVYGECRKKMAPNFKFKLTADCRCTLPPRLSRDQKKYGAEFWIFVPGVNNCSLTWKELHCCRLNQGKCETPAA